MRNDYPQAASDNAQKAIDFKEEYGSDCGTSVGWFRARQLAERQEISDEIIKRTYSFLSRAKVYDQGEFEDADGAQICGSIMYAAWGGDEMREWAENAIQEMNAQEERPYPNEHAARITDPEQYDSFARENDAFGEGIDAIYGIKDGVSELQAIRFDKEKWSVQDAEMWLDEHDYDPILFEPAIEEAMHHEEMRALPNELQIGDFVRWNTSNGFAYGRILEIQADGDIEADSGFVITGTADDPAAKIRVYQYDEDQSAYVERSPALNVVHMFSTLEKYDAETRNGKPIIETRALGTTMLEERMVSGYAAVFNQESEDLGGFIEIIKPGAFSDVLENDVRALWNHDANYLLARTTSGTLKIAEDARGLYYEFDAPHTTYGNDLLELLRRGDVTQSSFGFAIKKDEWVSRNGITYRYIHSVSRLFDVSPVTYPAYPATTSQLKSQAPAEAREEAAPQEEAAAVPAPCNEVLLEAYRLRIEKQK
jgi:HK97 family phage prohead protease